jgi:hypothetical protein
VGAGGAGGVGVEDPPPLQANEPAINIVEIKADAMFFFILEFLQLQLRCPGFCRNTYRFLIALIQ